jgi:acyl carrier protein
MPGNLSKDQIKNNVYEVINVTLRIPTDKIKDNSRLFTDLGAESIDLLDIRFELERVFDLSIKDTEISESIGKDATQGLIHEMLTVSKITEFVEKKLSA